MNCPKCDSTMGLSRMVSYIEAVEHLVCHDCMHTFMLVMKGGGDGALMVDITECIEYLEKNVWKPLGDLFSEVENEKEEREDGQHVSGR